VSKINQHETKNSISNHKRLNPEAGSAMTLSLGLLLARARQGNEALEKLSLESKSGAALLATGCILQERNDLNGAMSRYKIAATLMPESAALWNNVGLCFLKKQKYVAVSP
jgi:Bardet-Biedl syndrome 4 protein